MSTSSIIAAEFNSEVVDSSEVMATMVHYDGYPLGVGKNLLNFIGKGHDTDKIWEIIETSGYYSSFVGEFSLDENFKRANKVQSSVYSDADFFLDRWQDTGAEYLYFLRAEGEIEVYTCSRNGKSIYLGELDDNLLEDESTFLNS